MQPQAVAQEPQHPLGAQRVDVGLNPHHVTLGQRSARLPVTGLQHLPDPVGTIGRRGQGLRRCSAAEPLIGHDDDSRCRIALDGKVARNAQPVPADARAPRRDRQQTAQAFEPLGNRGVHAPADAAASVAQHPMQAGQADRIDRGQPLIQIAGGVQCDQAGHAAPGQWGFARPAAGEIAPGRMRVAGQSAVLALVEGGEHGPAGPCPYLLLPHWERMPAARPQETSAATLLHEQILAIRAGIGDPPRQVPVPPGCECRPARHRGPHDPEIRRLQHRFVPDGRQAGDVQMRVVAEQRSAGRRQATGDRPRVAASR